MAVTNFSISVSTTQTDTIINAKRGYILINDGAAEVFFTCDQTTTVATTGAGLKVSDPPLSVNDTCSTLRTKTASGTATLRVFALE